MENDVSLVISVHWKNMEKYGEASFQCCVMLIDDSKFGDFEMLQKLIGMIYRIVRLQRAVYMLNGFLELYLR